MKHQFYSENINLKLLMNLGAHIGHAKIDWNTDNNAYLAGLTNNNYIVFDINKTLYFFKRSLHFMYLIGYNNGKFAIYYPGDNSFYKLVMEGALDKEGLLPTKYPFIHSLVKPGFFSNWRVNYKRLVKRFFKVIFWNPFFFGGMSTKFLHTNINKLTFRKNINISELNLIRLKSDQWIQAMVNPMRIYRRMRRPHFRSFKRKFKITKRLISKLNQASSNYKFLRNSLELDKIKQLDNCNKLNNSYRKTTDILVKYKFNTFFKQSFEIDKLLIACRYSYGLNKFTLFSNGFFKVYSFYNSNYRSEASAFISKTKKYNVCSTFSIDLFSSFVTKLLLGFNHDDVFKCYFSLKAEKNNYNLRQFLNHNTMHQLVSWANFLRKRKNAIEIKKKYRSIKKRELILKNLTKMQEKNRKRKLYYSKLNATNPYILNQFINNVQEQKQILNVPSKFSMGKIHSFFNMLMNRYRFNHFKKKAQVKTNRTRTESLKMLYYNIYDMLVSIALRKSKYSNNNDDLTPYEQQFFRRFVKFMLVFRYLKRIKRIPSAIVLLNSDVHESQYTDFKLLNTAVIGIADSNIQFTSLSYFIPSNDDNLVLFLYYVKMLCHSFNSGRKHSFLETLIPKFMNNLSRQIDYPVPFVYQYSTKLNSNDSSNLLPFGSSLDRAHIERLELRRKARIERQLRYKKWKQERLAHIKRRQSFWKGNNYNKYKKDSSFTKQDLKELIAISKLTKNTMKQNIESTNLNRDWNLRSFDQII